MPSSEPPSELPKADIVGKPKLSPLPNAKKVSPIDDDGDAGVAKKAKPPAAMTPGQVKATPEGAERARRESILAFRKQYDERARLKSKVLLPDSKVMRYWDGIVACCLIFTALVTPFEIAYLPLVLGNFLFCVNRIVDLCFFADIFVNFKLAYFDPHKGMMVIELPRIQRRYLTSWFTIDVLSLVPWDLLDVSSQSRRRLADDASSGSGSQMKLLRLLKILKLTKLLRLVKSARIFKRLATHLSLTFGIQLLIKYFVIMVCATHWVACGWGMVPTFMQVERPPADDDVGRMLKGGGGGGGGDSEAPPGLDWIMRVEDQLQVGSLSVAHKYAYCLEYALGIMCMGYASVTQENMTELWYSVFCLIFAGSLYAYMIGGICSALALEDPAETEFKENMDLLMKFMEEKEIPDDLRVRSYEYMEYCKSLMLHRYHVQVLELMPKSIRGDICRTINGEWIKKMTFFNAKSERERGEFVMAISCALEPFAYPPSENIYVVGDRSQHLYIVTRGLVKHMLNFNFRVMIPGDFFGEDFLVEDYFRFATTKSLSYCECSLLERDDLYSILEDRPALFEETTHLIRKESIRIQLYNHIVTIGHLIITLKIKEGYKRVTERDISDYREKARLNREKRKLQNKSRSKTPIARPSEADGIVEKLIDLTKKDNVREIVTSYSKK